MIVNQVAAGGTPRLITEIIPGSQNWACPEGVTSVDVLLFGAGGGGGIRGGGGGGHMAQGALTVTPGNTYAITVGIGGYSYYRSDSYCDSGTGEVSSFGTLLSASGGSKGVYTGGAGGSGGGGGYVSGYASYGGSATYGGGGGRRRQRQ